MSSDEDTNSVIKDLKASGVKVYDMDSIHDTFDMLKLKFPSKKDFSKTRLFNFLKNEDKVSEEVTPLFKERILNSNNYEKLSETRLGF